MQDKLKNALNEMLDDYTQKFPGTIEEHDGIRKVYPSGPMDRMQAHGDGECAFIEPWDICRAVLQRKMNRKIHSTDSPPPSTAGMCRRQD